MAPIDAEHLPDHLKCWDFFLNWINYSSAPPSLRAKSSLRDTCVSLCLFSIFKNQQSRPWRQITNFKISFFKSFFKCFDFIQAFVEKGQSNQCSAGRGFLDSELNCNIKSIFSTFLFLTFESMPMICLSLNWIEFPRIELWYSINFFNLHIAHAHLWVNANDLATLVTVVGKDILVALDAVGELLAKDVPFEDDR